MSKGPQKGSLKRPARVFYGWWLVAIATFIDALGQGALQRSFSIYFLPIQKDLDLSTTRYSLADPLARIEGAAQGPVVGYVTDRVGPRPMMVAGGVLVGLGFILLSFTHNYLHFLLVYVALLSAGIRLGYNNASTTAVNQWFRRKRGLAMAILSTGQALGGAVITPLVTLMVTGGLGWRNSALISGIVLLVLVIPLSLLIRRSPESMGLLPDGDLPESLPARLRAAERQRESTSSEVQGSSTAGSSAGQTSGEIDFTTKEAMKTSSFWLFVFATGLRNSASAGWRWHLARMIVWSGTSLRTAGFFVAFLYFSTLILNPIVGWLGDKWPKPKISAVATVAGALGLAVLAYSSGRLWELALFVILLGISDTANPLTWSIMGDFFGRKSFATLRGWQHLPDELMSASTPLWVALIFDRTDSYFWALVPLVTLYVMSAFFHWILRRPRIPARLAQT